MTDNSEDRDAVDKRVRSFVQPNNGARGHVLLNVRIPERFRADAALEALRTYGGRVDVSRMYPGGLERISADSLPNLRAEDLLHIRIDGNGAYQMLLKSELEQAFQNGYKNGQSDGN
jgi:hypothetical protein